MKRKKIFGRKMLCGFALAVTGIALFSCEKEASPANTNNPDKQAAVKSASVQALAISGNGVNLQPSYYNNGNPNFGWSLMKQQTKIKTVRIEIEPDKVSQAANWISQAKSNGYAIIATYHKASVLGSDNTSELTAAANWWKNNYAALGGGFTINLMNEWGSHNLTATGYANAYNTAIGIVRQVYTGPIVIDCSGYGQETAIASSAVKGYGTGGVKINDTNIILSAHIYPNGYNQAKGRNVNQSDMDDLASAGRTCIIGEFGNSPSGSVDWAGIVDYARGKGWTVLAWAWNGDGGSMNMVTPSWASNGSATSFSLSGYFNTVYSHL